MKEEGIFYYGKILFDLNISPEIVLECFDIFNNSNELLSALSSPVVKLSEKSSIIDKIFKPEIRGFLYVLCENNNISSIFQIIDTYNTFLLESKNLMKAIFIYAKKPEEIQLESLKKMLCKKYNKSNVILELKEDKSILGGCILQIHDFVYDRSVKSKLLSLKREL